jgi:glutathione S-transferase
MALITLYHCSDARSFRPLWTLEELGLDYQLKMLPFPPRVLAKEYLQVNPLGTIPTLIDGPARMTESAAMVEYLIARHGPDRLGVAVDDALYGVYLNWLHHGEATLTFPQTIVLRYTRLEPEGRRLQQAVDDYTQWFFARLRSVEAATADQAFLCAGRFTIADIAVGYALYLAETLGLRPGFKPNTEAYYQRLETRPAFQKALAL